jgi:formylglycine-generating enzyme required for sulfatase activity
LAGLRQDRPWRLAHRVLDGRRPQFSLAYLLVMVIAAGAGLLGGMHWWESARLWAEAEAEYQGALARYNEADESEKPAHEVTLTQPYYLGRFEVTQKQYEHVMGDRYADYRRGAMGEDGGAARTRASRTERGLCSAPWSP